MNLVNYSDDSGSENEKKVNKQQLQFKEMIKKDKEVPQVQPQQPKKKKLMGIDDILNQNFDDQNIADGKYIPHKKLKVNDDKDEQQREEQKKNTTETIQKSENYEIKDLQKTRKVPHVDGQFACYIYIDVRVGLSSLVKAQNNFKNRVNKEYPEYQFMDIEPDNFHISLSKTFFLNRHQIEPFMTSLRDSNITIQSIMFYILPQLLEYHKN